ncbi:helix-turn-helix domain-containing protein [Nonomuraea salmonea]|uniref:helix-turn-helix domain-containing protein n=1 Tax=Nonomuraea salmonea TaxID=46181 RepID=UPI003CD0BD7F
MPEGRLTRQDRQRIAAGLAEGRSYAEIARRLDRPTSTVSREVGRNGGPSDYRPERAHQAAARRARRRTPARSPNLTTARSWKWKREPSSWRSGWACRRWWRACSSACG